MKKYRLRLLYGFTLKDLVVSDVLEELLKAFDDVKSELLQDTTDNTPFTLFIVNYETAQVVKEFTKYPK